MVQKKFYCPYCPERDRKGMAGPGLGAHQRAKHPGKPYKKLIRKKGPQTKEKKEDVQFSLEPIGGNAASDFDAEFRLRIVLRIDVEK